MKLTLVSSIFASLLILQTGTMQGEEVMVNTSEGEIFVLDIDPNESVENLQQKIVALSGGSESPFVIEFASRSNVRGWCLKSAHTQGGYLGYPRNYSQELSHEERSDIRFIVTSLANKSLISIAVAKDDLEAAGDRIEHVHPLRFLMAVFTDEELKVGIRNIRGRGWVWSHFTAGLKQALTTETGIGNMKSEFIYHFAQTVQINPDLIIPSLSRHNWDEFIDALITHIPRLGDHDRYDT